MRVSEQMPQVQAKDASTEELLHRAEQLEQAFETLRHQEQQAPADLCRPATSQRDYNYTISLSDKPEEELGSLPYTALLKDLADEREAKEQLIQKNDTIRIKYESLQNKYAALQSDLKDKERQLQESREHAKSLTSELNRLKIDMRFQSDAMKCWQVSKKAFGKESWRKYFGEIDNEPSLPDDIDTIWNGPCPFWPNKKVGDTHMLVLVPAAINGKPFTLNLLEELVRSPLNTLRSYETRFRLYNYKVQEEYGHNSPGRSYWILMTKDIIPDSAQKDYLAQQGLIADHARKHNLGYKLPGVLEATTAILTHYVRSGKRLYADDPVTYTRCFEQIDGPHPVDVGNFSDEGLHVRLEDHEAHRAIGVSCLRKIY